MDLPRLPASSSRPEGAGRPTNAPSANDQAEFGTHLAHAASSNAEDGGNRALTFQEPETPGAAFQPVTASADGRATGQALRQTPGDRPYFDNLGSIDSTYTGGPQRTLPGNYNNADCGQYAHGTTQYNVNSINPHSGHVGTEQASAPSGLNPANSMSGAELHNSAIPAGANAIAYQEPGGRFHYARIAREANGVQLSHTDAFTHHENGGGGTFRTQGLSLNTIAQRSAAPAHTLNSPGEFADYCENKYGSGRFHYTT